MADSFERAWKIIKMPNMFGDDPMDGNSIDGPLGQGSHADSMRQMNPRLLDALINMKVEQEKYPPMPPMHQDPTASPPMMPEPYDPEERMRTPPREYPDMGQKPMDMEEEKDFSPKGSPYEADPAKGWKPDYMEQTPNKKYKESPAEKPKLGQGLIDRARKNTHTMPGSSKFEKPDNKKDSKKDSKKEE